MSETQIIGGDFTVTSSTPLHKLGTEVKDGDTVYRYLKASGTAITSNVFCYYDQTNTAVAATTTAVGSYPLNIACPQVAIPASYYGWFVVQGAFTGFLGASCAAAVKLYTTATGGLADDTATTLIAGVISLDSVGGSNANGSCYAFKKMAVNQ